MPTPREIMEQRQRQRRMEAMERNRREILARQRRQPHMTGRVTRENVVQAAQRQQAERQVAAAKQDVRRVEAQVKEIEVIKPIEVNQPEPPKPQPRTTLPEVPKTLRPGDANQLRAHFGQAQDAVLRGVSSGQDTAGAQKLANSRIQEYWQEFDLDVAGLRSAYESQLRWFPRAIASSESHIKDLKAGRFGNRRPTQSMVKDSIKKLEERISTLQGDQAKVLAGQRAFDQYVRDLKPVIQDTINESYAKIPDITKNLTGAKAVRKPEEAKTPKLDVKAILKDEPGAKFQMLDKDGKSVGYASDQKAVDAAIKQGFTVRPVTVTKAVSAEPSQPAKNQQDMATLNALADRQETAREAQIDQSKAVQTIQQKDVKVTRHADGSVEVNLVEALEAGMRPELVKLGFNSRQLNKAEQQRRAYQRLTEMGYATGVGGNVDVVGAAKNGLQAVLNQAGFTEAQITQAKKEQFDQEVSAKRMARQSFDPGAAQAMSLLEKQGLANTDGEVNAIKAVEEGKEGLLLQAGFTQSQVKEAKQNLADMKLAATGGSPGGADATGQSKSRAFPVGQPATTELATLEALEADAKRQAELDKQLLGLRGILRQSDSKIGGPQVRAAAEEKWESLIQEKTDFQNKVKKNLASAWGQIKDLPDLERFNVTSQGKVINLQPGQRAVVTGSPAIPIPGLPIGGGKVTVATAAVIAAAVAAETLRENPNAFKSTARQQVTPGDVSPPSFPLVRPDTKLPGVKIGKPGELGDIPPVTVNPPKLPGMTRTVPPEVAMVLSASAEVVEIERDIRKDFPNVPESIEEYLNRPTSADPTVGKTIDQLIEDALKEKEVTSLSALQQERLRDALSNLEVRRRILDEALKSLVKSQGFSPKEAYKLDALQLAAKKAFQRGVAHLPRVSPSTRRALQAQQQELLKGLAQTADETRTKGKTRTKQQEATRAKEMQQTKALTQTKTQTKTKAKTKTQTRTRAATAATTATAATAATTAATTTATTVTGRVLPPLPGGNDQDAGKDGKRLKVAGLNRGAVGDTSVNLVTGQSRTLKDIEAVGESPTRTQAVKLAYGAKDPKPRREPWGFMDRIIWPDGTVTTVKAGAPIKRPRKAPLKKGRKL